jgi:heme-degrading monooxygenase HmoA
MVIRLCGEPSVVHQLWVWVIGAMMTASLRHWGADQHGYEEASMEYFVWVTTRKIRAGALDDFEQVWQPNPYPEGLARAYAYWSEDGQEIIGVSFWDLKESCDAWRDSEAEQRRRQAMAPYVLEAREAFYRGRELRIPGRQR